MMVVRREEEEEEKRREMERGERGSRSGAWLTDSSLHGRLTTTATTHS